MEKGEGVRKRKPNRPVKEGDRLYRLVAIRFIEKRKFGNLWEFKCDCGKITQKIDCNASRGQVKSCGCQRTDSNKERMTTHGLCKTPEYQIYHGMKQRCCNPDERAFPNYGGRGIKVCDRWLEGFENFIADMGPRPSKKHSIDRIDNNGNYEPGNCRWTTIDVQLFNRRTTSFVTYEGVTKPIREWCAELNMKLVTFKGRIRRGWTVEKLINQPVDVKSRKKSNPSSNTIPAIL